MSSAPELTIGMATYQDFDGVYFTLQALRLYQDLSDTELLVVDNYGSDEIRHLVADWIGARYVHLREPIGTAAPRETVFREARGAAVLCCDCHVLFVPGAIARLKEYHRRHPHSQDLLHGPLLHDDARSLGTHWEPIWREGMWGTWATDPRGLDPQGEPFEVPMAPLGAFSCRRNAWVGFHPQFRGFGGEEGYLHEKFRRAGGRALCLPWLRWMHRFPRPDGVPYPLTLEDRFRNYLLGFSELGWDVQPLVEHFRRFLATDRLTTVLQDTLQVQWLTPITA